MNANEVRELMRIKGWTKTKLAAELNVTQQTVERWSSLKIEQRPKGPAALLLKMWLEDARKNQDH